MMGSQENSLIIAISKDFLRTNCQIFPLEAYFLYCSPFKLSKSLHEIYQVCRRSRNYTIIYEYDHAPSYFFISENHYRAFLILGCQS